MHNRVVKVEIHKTIQEQQFEPLKVAVSLEAEIADSADFNKELEEARDLCRNQVHEEIAEWLN